MCRVLLGLIISLPLPGGQAPSHIIKAVRTILDFVYLAQFSSHMTATLHSLEESLSSFHANKTVFIDLGTQEGFNIPKLHSMLHYVSSVLLFGTTDNYNTEQMEQLHIDFTKNTYWLTNCKNKFAQMTIWLERREKIQWHAAHITRQQDGVQHEAHTVVSLDPPCIHHGYLKMLQNPTLKSVSFQRLAHDHGTHLFQDALGDFIAHINCPVVSAATLHTRASDTLIPFFEVPVFHKFKFTANRNRDKLEVIDSVQVCPAQTNHHDQIIPAQFDTVLVSRGQHNKGTLSYCILF